MTPPRERLAALTRAGVVVTAAVMPLYVVRFRAGPFPTTLLELSLLITVALCAATLAFRQAPLPAPTGYEIPIAMLLVAGVIGVFVAPDHRAALGALRAYLLEPVVLFYVAVAVFGRLEQMGALFLSVAAATVLYCIVDASYFLKSASEGRLVPGHVAAVFTLDPNYVALYLEPLIGFAGGVALFATGRQRSIAVATLIVMVPAEVATFSRGGLVALAVMACIVVLTVRNNLLRVAVVVAGSAAALVVWNLPALGDRVRQLLSPSHGTLSNRTRIWLATARMLRDHPLFGAGLNAYQSVMAAYRRGDPYLVPEPYPHNIALTSWTELGVLGVIAFLWILIGLIVRAWRSFGPSRGMERAVFWGTGTAFVLIAVHGLVDTPYWKNDLSVEFWLLAATQVVALSSIRSVR